MVERHVALAALLVVLPLELGSESLVLQTYYPSPLGIYSNLTTTGDTILARDGGGVTFGSPSGGANPAAKLDIDGPISIRGGSPGSGRVLTSDAAGLASWKDPTSILASGTLGPTPFNTDTLSTTFTTDAPGVMIFTADMKASNGTDNMWALIMDYENGLAGNWLNCANQSYVDSSNAIADESATCVVPLPAGPHGIRAWNQRGGGVNTRTITASFVVIR